MKNSMVKEMTGRYAEYMNTAELIERVAKNILYWVMSMVEAIFWGLGRVASLTIDLYASEEKIFLVFRHPTGEEYEFVYYSTNNCSDGKLQKMLKKFVDIFNNYEYPLSERVESPFFRACYYGKQNSGEKYSGYEYINIYVNMSPNSDSDRENHGRH